MFMAASAAVRVRLGRQTASDTATLGGTAASLRGGARSQYGPQLAGVESPARDVNLAGLPLALNGVGHGRGLLTEHVHHPRGLPNHRRVLYRGGIRSSLSAY